MIFSTLAVVVCLAVVMNNVASLTSPAFCNGLECPYYNSTSNETINGHNIEFRYYPSQYWVSSSIIGEKFDDAEHDGFEDCFNYISGENSNSTKIDMTAPVTVYATRDELNYTVSFYVPYDTQVDTGKTPPEPTEEHMFINQLAAMNVAVLSFAGLGSEETVFVKMEELTDSLDSAKIVYDKNYWFFADYDSPFQITDRHQEIWIQVEN